MYYTVYLLLIVLVSPCLAMYTISDYRLISKDRPNAGIVEVYNQVIGWGFVCQSYFSFKLASKVCSQLNFPGTSRHLTAEAFNDDGDEWPMSVTNNISTYFTGCSINGMNMQCDTCNGKCGCKRNNLIGAVSCKEPGYLGCFRDDDSLFGRDRVLSNGLHYYYNDLTIDLCINACAEGGYFYAGVEFEYECFCGGQDENITKYGNAPDRECVDVCTGDPLESCGDSNRIAIYQVDLGVCEDPGTPRYGFRYNETGSLRYGSKIYFNCSDEFTLEGPDVIQCVQMYGRRENVSIANNTHAVMWNQSIPKCTGISSTTTSSATTKGGGQTSPMPSSATTGPLEQSGHQVIIYISIGIVSGLLIINAIIVVVVICKRHIRRSNIALRQSVGAREGQELDPYTSLDATTMKQPAYEDIKATTRGDRGHTNAIEGVEYGNQTIVKHPYTSLDATTMEQPAYDDTIATTSGDRGQMNAIEGVEYGNQRIVKQTARVKKSNLGVADGNTEPEYELLN